MMFFYLFRSHLSCSLQSPNGFGFVFLPVILRVHGDLCPYELSRVTPVIEQDTLFEWLASGRNYDDVMLGTGVDKRLSPVKLERLQLHQRTWQRTIPRVRVRSPRVGKPQVPAPAPPRTY